MLDVKVFGKRRAAGALALGPRGHVPGAVRVCAVVLVVARDALGVFHLEVVHAETGFHFARFDVESVPLLDGVEETCFRKKLLSVKNKLGAQRQMGIDMGNMVLENKSYR